jgi:energy-coupling factor transport system permease protein
LPDPWKGGAPLKSFVWHEADSYLHRLNPLPKLALTLPVVIVASRAEDPIAPLGVVLVSLLATRLLGRVPWSRILAPVGLALLLSFGMFWMGALFYANPGVVYTESSPVGLTFISLLNGATMASRLLAIFGASLLFVLTTDPVKLVLALIHQARMPYRIGYSVFASYRFMPLFQEELDNIRAAHMLRQGTGGSPLERMRRAAGYAVPLLAIAVRKGERVALAMDARAFGAIPKRTYYRTSRLTNQDVIFSAGALLMLAAIALAAHYIATMEGIP